MAPIPHGARELHDHDINTKKRPNLHFDTFDHSAYIFFQSSRGHQVSHMLTRIAFFEIPSLPPCRLPLQPPSTSLATDVLLPTIPPLDNLRLWTKECTGHLLAQSQTQTAQSRDSRRWRSPKFDATFLAILKLDAVAGSLPRLKNSLGPEKARWIRRLF